MNRNVNRSYELESHYLNGPGITQDGDCEENSFHGGIVL